HPPLDYPATVATTWSLSMQRIDEASQAGAELMNLCAYLGPDSIPRSILGGLRKHTLSLRTLPALLAGSLAVEKACQILRQYSLIQWAESTFSMHRLVQTAIRDSMPENDRKKWAEAAVLIINDAFPSNSDDVRSWQSCIALLPHARITCEHAEELGVALDKVACILNWLGAYLLGRAEYADAEPLLRRAMKIRETQLGPEHPEVAESLNCLALLLQARGQYAAAEPLHRRALEIRETQLGPEHPEVAASLKRLADFLF